MEPLFTAPRDGSWVRLFASGLGITSHPVRWCETGRRGPGWYSKRGERLAVGVFDLWLPVKDAPPAWCEVLGLARTASEAEIRAAHRELSKQAHPDVGGSTEAMQRLNHARDEALAAVGR